jgi:cytochrome P450 family 110
MSGAVPRLQMPAFQQTLQFLRDPIPLIERGVAECGDIFALNILGFGTWVFVCSPEGVEQMVRLPNDVLVGDEVNRQFFSAFFANDSLFFLEGPQHLERRRLLLSFFQDHGNVPFAAIVERVTRRMLDSWPIGRPFALLPELQEISFQIIMETIFGFEVFPDPAPIVDLLRRTALKVYVSPMLAMPALQVDLGRFSPWGRLMRLHTDMCSMLDAEIRRRRMFGNVRDRKDLLSLLIVYQMEHPGVLTDQVLRDEVLGMLAAGLNSTVFMSGWAIECALSFPGVLERIRSEVDEVVADAAIGSTHLPRLTYLDAVINESIRHRMPSPITGVRFVKKSASLCGYDVPQGALVAMCLAGLGMRKDLFPEPRQFRPEHFFERKFSAFEWNIYGLGTRQCVAKALGQIELRVVIATILRRAQLRLVDMDRRRVRSGMFFVPKHGLRVELERRR